jgi:hypothetical protein
MRKFCVVFAVLAGIASMQAQKTRMGQELPFAKPGVAYPLTVHLYGIHVRPFCRAGDCEDGLFFDVVSNTRKLELSCGTGIPGKPYSEQPFAFGDFQARTLGRGLTSVNLGDEYELLLPNRRVLGCVVSGMME